MNGRGGARASTGRRAWAAGIALVLAVGLSLAPPAAAPVVAATGAPPHHLGGDLQRRCRRRVVHVVDAVTLSNDKPSDADFFYIWRDLSWSVQPGATRIAVRDPDGSLAVTPRARDGLHRGGVPAPARPPLRPVDRPHDQLGPARRRAPLGLLDPGGPGLRLLRPLGVGRPGVLVGHGDRAGGLRGPDVRLHRRDRRRARRGHASRRRRSTIRPTSGSRVTATRDRSLATEELQPSRDVTLLVKGWPEDELWLTTVTTTLDRGLSELRELIGLPWPVTNQLVVSEVYSPLLEGYAGIYYTAEDRIEISEDLDDLVIVHELSHAWFNDGLFTDRWIDEGLADTYAAITLEALGEDRQLPDEPLAGDEGRLDLVSWGPPERITDETAARETYAYNASWFVGNGLVEEVGPAGMRAIFRAAHDDRIAYRGAGPAEEVAGARWLAPLPRSPRGARRLDDGRAPLPRLRRDARRRPRARRPVGRP